MTLFLSSKGLCKAVALPQLMGWSIDHNIFALADGRDARLPTSIGSKILLRRESTASDTRIHGHRRKVTEPAWVIVAAALCEGNDASGGVDRARAGDLYQRLMSIPFGEHVCGRCPGRGIGKRPVEKHFSLRLERTPPR